MNPILAWLRGLFPHQHVAGEWTTVYPGICISMQEKACIYCHAHMADRDVPTESATL